MFQKVYNSIEILANNSIMSNIENEKTLTSNLFKVTINKKIWIVQCSKKMDCWKFPAEQKSDEIKATITLDAVKKFHRRYFSDILIDWILIKCFPKGDLQKQSVIIMMKSLANVPNLANGLFERNQQQEQQERRTFRKWSKKCWLNQIGIVKRRSFVSRNSIKSNQKRKKNHE